MTQHEIPTGWEVPICYGNMKIKIETVDNDSISTVVLTEEKLSFAIAAGLGVLFD